MEQEPTRVDFVLNDNEASATSIDRILQFAADMSEHVPEELKVIDEDALRALPQVCKKVIAGSQVAPFLVDALYNRVEGHGPPTLSQAISRSVSGAVFSAPLAAFVYRMARFAEELSKPYPDAPAIAADLEMHLSRYIVGSLLYFGTGNASVTPQGALKLGKLPAIKERYFEACRGSDESWSALLDATITEVRSRPRKRDHAKVVNALLDAGYEVLNAKRITHPKKSYTLPEGEEPPKEAASTLSSEEVAQLLAEMSGAAVDHQLLINSGNSGRAWALSGKEVRAQKLLEMRQHVMDQASTPKMTQESARLILGLLVTLDRWTEQDQDAPHARQRLARVIRAERNQEERYRVAAKRLGIAAFQKANIQKPTPDLQDAVTHIRTHWQSIEDGILDRWPKANDDRRLELAVRISEILCIDEATDNWEWLLGPDQSDTTDPS